MKLAYIMPLLKDILIKGLDICTCMIFANLIVVIDAFSQCDLLFVIMWLAMTYSLIVPVGNEVPAFQEGN